MATEEESAAAWPHTVHARMPLTQEKEAGNHSIVAMVAADTAARARSFLP
jgi:hypothetical protein